LLEAFDRSIPNGLDQWERETNQVIREIKNTAQDLPTELRVKISMTVADPAPKKRLLPKTAQSTYENACNLLAGVDNVHPSISDRQRW